MMPPSSRRLPRRAPWFALGSALLIGAAPFVACPRLERWRGEEEAETALAALRGCLGGAEIADAVLRARVIGADLEGDDWPRRCLAHAAEAEVALTRAQQAAARCDGSCCDDDTACVAIAQRRHRLAELHEQLEARRFDGGVAAALLAIPAAPSTSPAPRQPAPPGPALVGYPHEQSALVRTDRGATLLLHRRNKRADLCTIDFSAAAATCHMVDPAVPIGDALLIVDGAPDAPPHLLARDTEIAPERWGLFRADGGAVLAVEGRAPLGAAPGGVLVAGRDGYALLQPEREPVPIASEITPLLDGSGLYRVIDGALRGGAIDAKLPDLDGTAIALENCRGDAPVVLAVADDGAAEVRAALAFPGRERAIPLSPGVRWFGFTCAGATASLTWIEERWAREHPGGVRGSYGVERIRCTQDGCQPERAEVPLDRHHRGSRYLVASAGDDLVLAWRSGAGDVRHRRAPMAELAAAPPHLVVDDAAHGGLDWEAGAELLVLGDDALLLVDGREATHAWVLDRDRARPVTIAPADG